MARQTKRNAAVHDKSARRRPMKRNIYVIVTASANTRKQQWRKGQRAGSGKGSEEAVVAQRKGSEKAETPRAASKR